MSNFVTRVFDAARFIATKASAPETKELAPEVPLEPVQKHHDEKMFTLDQVTPNGGDKTIVIPVVLEEWSLLDKINGEFVAPQGVGLVPCILQIEATTERPKVVTGNVLMLSFTKMMATTQGNSGVQHRIHLGKCSKAYADFFMMTRLARPYLGFNEDQLPPAKEAE